MTVNRELLEKLGRFLLRGLRIGASTVSVVKLLRNDWSGGCRPSARSLRSDSQLGAAAAAPPSWLGPLHLPAQP